MTGSFSTLFGRTPAGRRWAGGAALAGLLLLPLAVAGLFTGALATADQRIDDIPAIVVNNDRLVTSTQPDGSEQKVLAGRQLVTELTAPHAAGFHWSISNSRDAAAELAAGRAYVVLTIPADFSASITSLAGTDPKKANITLRTDDAHSYLAGSAAQSVGSAMAGAFGTAITSRYLAGFYDQLSVVGSSLSTAAGGATEISTGVDALATGLDSLAAGSASAASGASTLSSGIADYTAGVSDLSAGLNRLSEGAGRLAPLQTGLPQYAAGVQQTADGFRQLRAALDANPTNAPYAASFDQMQAGLDALASQGAQLGQAAGGLGGVTQGIAASAAGASRLAGGAAGLTSGASSLAGGIADVSTGASASASGARELGGGASELAEGLKEAATKATSFGGTDPTVTAEVVADPVTVTTTRNHALSSIGPVIGMLFVPVGLWIGALAIFLLLSPLSALALASTASTGRLVLRGLGRGVAIAAAQALAVVALLHSALGVPWGLFPATLSFSVLVAVVFAVLHYLLAAAFGKLGIVISLVLLALQLTAVGGLYPLEIVAKPFQAVSPVLPLTWAVRGLQAIVSGGNGGDVAASVAALAVFGILGAALAFLAVARRRGPRSFGFTLATS